MDGVENFHRNSLWHDDYLMGFSYKFNSVKLSRNWAHIIQLKLIINFFQPVHCVGEFVRRCIV